MKTIKIKLFQFEELSDEAKEKAIENERNSDCFLCYDWYDSVYEAYREKLEEFGFSDIEFAFSGFWSQGDGASFTAKNLDVSEYLKKTRQKTKYCCLNPIELYGDVRRTNSHYVHERSTDFYMYDNIFTEGSKADKLFLELEQNIQDFCYEQNKALYRDLEQEYEHLSSNEQIAETFTINDWYFTEDGTFYHAE